jgi:hypothetical protein
MCSSRNEFKNVEKLQIVCLKTLNNRQEVVLKTALFQTACKPEQGPQMTLKFVFLSFLTPNRI